MKFKNLNFLVIITYLLSSSFAYSIDLPDIKNIIIHKEKKKINKVEFFNSESKKVSLNEFSSNLVIINFWATWCAPCRREMPSLEKLTHLYPEVKVFAINMEKPNKLKTQDFFKFIGVLSLDIYFDPELKLVKQFKMRGLPTSILIDKNGREFGRIVGEIDFTNEEFIKILKNYI